MPTDLTERLAAKLVEARVRNPHSTSEQARVILPLLLSEPELVASLPDAVRVKALESLLNAAPVMESAFVDAAEVLALAPEELRLSVLTPRERAVMKLGECAARSHEIERVSAVRYTVFGTEEECAAFYAKAGYTEAEALAVEHESRLAYSAYTAALAEARALSPESAALRAELEGGEDG